MKKEIKLRSKEAFAGLEKLLDQPLPLNIIEMTYDNETDRFLTHIDIGLLQFSTLLSLPLLEELTDYMREQLVRAKLHQLSQKSKE